MAWNLRCPCYFPGDRKSLGDVKKGMGQGPPQCYRYQYGLGSSEEFDYSCADLITIIFLEVCNVSSLFLEKDVRTEETKYLLQRL